MTNSTVKSQKNITKYAGAFERGFAYLLDFTILLIIRSTAVVSVYMIFFKDKIMKILNQYSLIFGEGDYTRNSPEVMEFIKTSGIIPYSLTLLFVSVFIFLMIGCLYYTLMNISSWKTTLGGRLMSFYTVTDDLETVSLYRGFSRYFLSIIPWFLVCSLAIKTFALFLSGQDITTVTRGSHDFLVFTGLLYITWYDFILFNKKRKTVYDLLCKTVVIKGETNSNWPKWEIQKGKDMFALPKKILAEFKELKNKSKQKSVKKNTKKK